MQKWRIRLDGNSFFASVVKRKLKHIECRIAVSCKTVDSGKCVCTHRADHIFKRGIPAIRFIPRIEKVCVVILLQGEYLVAGN